MIVSQENKVEKLLVKALTVRPELKEKEELRLAARKEIVVKAAPLQPEVNFSTSVYGLGETLSNRHKNVTVQSASGPVTRSVSRQIKPLLVVGLNINWNLDGMGMKDLSAVQQARYEARKASLVQSKEVNKVVRQVRGSYLNVLRADRQIDEALARLRSSIEEINLARLRYENGLGKNIDVLRAQSDYTSALIKKAEAIVAYNVAQAKLIRDIGLTSVGTLTSRDAIRL
ncbi:MAG: TolC family protein [Cyanobacteriota/Melainabacteria group bacterium]